MKIKILFLCLVLVFPLIPQSKFKLLVTTDKQTYVMGEPVHVGISLINTGKNSVYAESLGKTELKLIDKNGNEVKRGGVAHVYWGPFKNHLEPDEGDYQVFLLNQHFGTNDFPGLIVEMYYEPGIYTVEAEFYPINSLDKIKANVSFEVRDVTGDELLVFNRFVDILKFEFQNKQSKQIKLKTASEFRKLYEVYPNSVYSPYILLILSALYDFPLEDERNGFWASKELVENFPWSVHSFNLLDRVMAKLNSDSSRIEYLKQLRNKSKGKLAEKVYEQKLQKLEKN